MKNKHTLKEIDSLSVDDFSKSQFFKDFLNKCYENKLVSDEFLQKIVYQRVELLRTQLKYYTRDESSSVMEETAEEVLKSIDYTIGYYLKKFHTSKDIINELKTKELLEIFNKGNKLIKGKVVECRLLLSNIQRNKLEVNNYSYNDTIDRGIEIFFKTYDDFFGAHESSGSIDYQLYIDDMDYISVEYLENYLKTLSLENKFCKKFDMDNINELLNGYDKKSELLLLNMFELVLINSLGLIICDKDPRSLNINEYDREIIKYKLKAGKVEEALLDASDKCCKILNIENIYLKEYINKSVKKAVVSIEDSLKLDKLENKFISFRTEKDKEFKYVDSKKLDDDTLRNIIAEISEAILIEEKIKLIKENIKSLADLTDMLDAECLYGDEYDEYFRSISSMEIALLTKFVDDTNYDLDNAKEWCIKLYDYINSLPTKEREMLEKIKENVIIT